MEVIDLLRAKSEGENKSLKAHTREVIKRAEQLKNFVEINGIYIKEKEKFFEALKIAELVHDFGKINYDFQKRVYDTNSNEWEVLEKFLKPIKGLRIKDHEILSAIWASILIKENDIWASRIRTAVLLHHYNNFYIDEKDLGEIYQNYPDDIKRYLEFLRDNWDTFKKFLEELFKNANIDDIAGKIDTSGERVNELLDIINNHGDLLDFAEFYEIDNENPDYDFMVFLGCLRRCDYSASGDINVEYSENPDKVLDKMKQEIESRFSKTLWQRDVLKDVDGESGVLIAPTGSGKTEFAILWASNTGRKFIYTLPLRVALNDIYHRFEDYLGDVKLLGLLHSTAFMEYVEEAKKFGDTSVDEKMTSASLLSHPVTLATPDQIFLTSLNYYGSDKIISIYPLSAIVLDEVQAYNPEMAAVIIKTLKIVEVLGGKILIITATLPPYFKPFFFRDKKTREDIPEDFRLNLEHKQMFDTEKVKNEIRNYELKRHKIKTIDEPLVEYIKTRNEKQNSTISVNEEVITKYLKKLKSDGKKSIFIVINNVSKAIIIYETLKNMKNEGKIKDDIFLLHSRLFEKVKDDTIRKIKEKLGEIESTDKNKGIIVVSTQIIEASVDLDFDGMLTEISPIDSQIQRWGRVYRKRNVNYEGEPNIYIFTKFDKDIGTKAIYVGGRLSQKGKAAEMVLEQTVNVLKKYEDEVLNYESEKSMINEVFDYEVDGRRLVDVYIKEIVENLDFLKYFTVEKKWQAQMIFRNIAGFQVVIPKIMEKYGEDWVKDIAKLIKNQENVGLTWEELENRTQKSKWEIRKALYEYSINVPVFYFNRIRNSIREFKGFYILNINDEDIDTIYRYGFDKIKERFKAQDEEYEIYVF